MDNNLANLIGRTVAVAMHRTITTVNFTPCENNVKWLDVVVNVKEHISYLNYIEMLADVNKSLDKFKPQFRSICVSDMGENKIVVDVLEN